MRLHRLHRLFVFGIGMAMVGSMPALAYQAHGGAAQGQRTPSHTPTGAQQGISQQDRLLDRDRLHDQDQDRLKDQDRLHDQDRDKDQDRDRLHDQDRDRDQIYASELMTPAERTAYQQKIRSLKTAQEREAFRLQHREQMQKRAASRSWAVLRKRAAERGVTLPDMQPKNGSDN